MLPRIPASPTPTSQARLADVSQHSPACKGSLAPAEGDGFSAFTQAAAASTQEDEGEQGPTKKLRAGGPLNASAFSDHVQVTKTNV